MPPRILLYVVDRRVSLSRGKGVTEHVRFTYRAFLSYSHRDTAWGKWLHSALESYRIDKDLVGRQTPAGLVPKTLRPIFRDREDFSAGHSLTEQTLAALEASQFLIVLCSPNAAKSKYVNEEVRRFKALGRADRVIPLIVEGEPGDAERECFPPALRFKLGLDGALTDEREEPIAADARPQGDGKGIALQKLVAGLLGVSFDDVRKRDAITDNFRIKVAAAAAAVFVIPLRWRPVTFYIGIRPANLRRRNAPGSFAAPVGPDSENADSNDSGLRIRAPHPRSGEEAQRSLFGNAAAEDRADYSSLKTRTGKGQ